MQKDPKRVLESFRVEEEDPLLHHSPRKFRKRKNELSQVSNTAILSLCLVTGLTSSVGSAFANSLDKENQNTPLDEPPSKVELENKAQLQQQEIPQNKSNEIIPTKPPLDEPASDVNKQKPENSDNKQKHIEEGNSETSKQTEKETKVLEKEEKVPQKAEEKANSDGKSSTAPKEESKTPSVEQKPVINDSSNSKRKEDKAAIPSTNEKEEKTKPVSKEQKEEKQEEKQVESKSASQNDVILPVTEEGGELPETAGDDLNQVALGAGLAIAGTLLLKRKRAKS